ncbi:DUF3472 domain-containing protein [Streptomyces triticagri]|uniref:DUF3472 domain-containing protein n=1 Tax=Streptomyces triticagri TaxID=2293568 RepID=A0A372M6I5_9ACTN|nr:DUF3472 domain-containing protein [Streptomyces triticagri]RFU86552.1 DUF3472 domain-containing protein [Streptomyces triticagri]
MNHISTFLKGRRGRSCAVIAAAAALTLTGSSATAGAAQDSEAAAEIGQTPGTYTYYGFDDEVTGLDEVTWSTTVDTDPGHRSQVFWSHQFGFDEGNGAYIGMQTNKGEGRMLLFSVWDVFEWKAGDEGSWCQEFGGEGEGASCRLRFNWQEGHTYTFKVASEGDGWFGATVTDTTAAKSVKLGSIRTPASQIDPAGMVDWTEYYEWNDIRTTCHDQPFSAARFGVPEGVLADGTRVTGAVSRTKSSDNPCAPMTRTETLPDGQGSVQDLAVGNSVRGALRAADGSCVGSAGDEPATGAAVAAPCGGGTGPDGSVGTFAQSWVLAADGSVRLPSDHCLTAEPGDASVSITDCAGPSADGAVTDPLKRWAVDRDEGTLVNESTGEYLTRTSSGLTLTDGSAAGARGWTLPAA